MPHRASLAPHRAPIGTGKGKGDRPGRTRPGRPFPAMRRVHGDPPHVLAIGSSSGHRGPAWPPLVMPQTRGYGLPDRPHEARRSPPGRTPAPRRPQGGPARVRPSSTAQGRPGQQPTGRTRPPLAPVPHAWTALRRARSRALAAVQQQQPAEARARPSGARRAEQPQPTTPPLIAPILTPTSIQSTPHPPSTSHPLISPIHSPPPSNSHPPQIPFFQSQQPAHLCTCSAGPAETGRNPQKSGRSGAARHMYNTCRPSRENRHGGSVALCCSRERERVRCDAQPGPRSGRGRSARRSSRRAAAERRRPQRGRPTARAPIRRSAPTTRSCCRRSFA